MLTFTVIEISPQEGYSIVRVQVGSASPDITTGDAFGLAMSSELAEAQSVGEPLNIEGIRNKLWVLNCAEQ